MSAKLRPEDLTSEERAIVDNAALFYRRVTGDVGETAEWAYVEALKEAEPIILARRALFAPAPEKVAKVCGNCGEKVSSLSDHVTCAETGDYYCQPAPPAPAAPVIVMEYGKCGNCGEKIGGTWDHYAAGSFTCQKPKPATPEPAAREMPEAVKWAIDFLRELGNEGNPNKQCTENICRQRADALESWWRNLAQPVAVGMTEELKFILDECTALSVDKQRFLSGLAARRLAECAAAVRQQAAQGRKVALPKVRKFLTYMGLYYKLPFSGAKHNAGTQGALWQDALAELDAAEGGK